MEYIQSKDNKTIKRMVALSNRKYRQKYDEYVLEGIRSIRDVAKMGAIKVIVIRESKMKEHTIQELLSVSDIQSVPTYIVQDPLFDKLENSVHGQGVMAIANKPKYFIDDLRITDGLYVALDGVQDPGNLGTIIRTAVAAGVKGIFSLKGTVDPFNDKTVRSTMSALHKIPLYEDVSLSEFYDVIREQRITTYVTALENSVPYQDIRYASRSLLVFGNEGNGVSKEILDFSDHRISIPMYGDIESLNVSIAAALCMYKVQEQLIK